MSTYKIKSISSNSIIIEYKAADNFTKELIVNIDKSWGKSRIEEEIAKQKAIHEEKQFEANLKEYFSEGEELEFMSITPEESPEEINRKFEEEQKIIAEENYNIKMGKVSEYPEINPSVEEQLDALYWMRQGDMAPIERVDKIITELKSQIYPKE